MSSGRRRWADDEGARGLMVSHPAVLADLRREGVGTRPETRAYDGVTVVTYRRTRFYLSRDAWEALEPDGVLLMRVRPANGQGGFDLALTLDELEDVFGEVKATESWDAKRCYHRDPPPPAARRFRVGGASPGALSPPEGEGRPGPPAAANKAPPARTRRGRGRPSPVVVPAGASRVEWARAWYAYLNETGETDVVESDGYLAEVHAWREAWRPERVRALLVAESHVGEMPGDTDIRLSLPSDAAEKFSLPDSYVRLIYCLGYGDEDRLCQPAPVPNEGTRDFWDIFARIATGSPTPEQLGGRTGAVTGWRVSILETLRARGIWLEDASPIGIYRPDRRTPTSNPWLRACIFREGYRRFIWPEVANDRPEQVWVIGHTVHHALAGLEGIEPERRTWQPRGAARHGRAHEYVADMDRLCRELAVIAP